VCPASKSRDNGIAYPFQADHAAQSHIDKQTQNFSTPGGANELEISSFPDTVFIQKIPYTTVVSTNKLAVERLIGLGFFQQFAYVILDYRDRRIYVSKARM